METQLEGKGKNDKELYELELYVKSLTERARWWWGTAPSEIRGESTKQYSRQTLVFLGGRCSRISGWTPEARSRICVCRASFLMTFVHSGRPPRLPAHDQCMLTFPLLNQSLCGVRYNTIILAMHHRYHLPRHSPKDMEQGGIVKIVVGTVGGEQLYAGNAQIQQAL